MKTNKKKRKKMRPLSYYKKKLWNIFSQYIRLRDADENGMSACISCGIVKHYKELHAGHYIPKSLGLSIYFEERNVHVQCPGCNTFKHGNLASYAIALRKKYGESVLEELDQQRHRSIQISRGGYQEMIERYEEKLKSLGHQPPGDEPRKVLWDYK